jgi:hypothetical protein
MKNREFVVRASTIGRDEGERKERALHLSLRYSAEIKKCIARMQPSGSARPTTCIECMPLMYLCLACNHVHPNN